MYLDLVSHLKLVWNLMLIMLLLVLGIGFLENIINLLVNVLDPLYEFGYFIHLNLRVVRLLLCGFKVESYINQGQWLKPQAHLKRFIDYRAMKISIVAMFNTRKYFIPSTWILGFLHLQDIHNHPIHHAFVYPSVFGWKVVNLVVSMSNSD